MCEVYIFLTAFKTLFICIVLESMRLTEKNLKFVPVTYIWALSMSLLLGDLIGSQSSLLSSLNEAVYTLISADNKVCTEQVLGCYTLSLSHTVVMLLILNHPIYNYYDYIIQDTCEAT